MWIPLFDMQKELEAEHSPNIPESLATANEPAYSQTSLDVFQKYKVKHTEKPRGLTKLTDLVPHGGGKLNLTKNS